MSTSRYNFESRALGVQNLTCALEDKLRRTSAIERPRFQTLLDAGALERLADATNAANYTFETVVLYDGKNRRVHIPSPALSVVDYAASRAIRTFLRVGAENRHAITKSLKKTLASGKNYLLLRADVAKFFESVNHSNLLNLFNGPINRLPRDCYAFVDALLDFERKHATNLESCSEHVGLPRGFATSSALADLIIANVARKMLAHRGIFTFSSFVDDILAIADPLWYPKRTGVAANESDWVRGLLANCLQEFGLSLNEDKTFVVSVGELTDSVAVQYLGYKYTVRKDGDKAVVDVDISDEKYRRIRVQIRGIFQAFVKERDFAMLKQRLRFLTANRQASGRLRVGIGFNFPLIDVGQRVTNLRELDAGLCGYLLGNRTRIARQVARLLSDEERKQLRKFGFVRGLTSRVCYRYTVTKLNRIKAWRRVW